MSWYHFATRCILLKNSVLDLFLVDRGQMRGLVTVLVVVLNNWNKWLMRLSIEIGKGRPVMFWESMFLCLIRLSGLLMWLRRRLRKWGEEKTAVIEIRILKGLRLWFSSWSTCWRRKRRESKSWITSWKKILRIRRNYKYRYRDWKREIWSWRRMWKCWRNNTIRCRASFKSTSVNKNKNSFLGLLSSWIIKFLIKRQNPQQMRKITKYQTKCLIQLRFYQDTVNRNLSPCSRLNLLQNRASMREKRWKRQL